MKKQIKGYMRQYMWPLRNPHGISLGPVITIMGFSVWAVCMVGSAALGWTVPIEVMEVGKAAFYFGIGRSSVDKNKKEEIEE